MESRQRCISILEHNTISYKILEVVARKYVLTFNCIELEDKYYESQKKYNKLKLINKNIKKEKKQKEKTTRKKNKEKIYFLQVNQKKN